MRKRRQPRISPDRWLVSYADFITLLFALFVVLFATGQSDRQKKMALAASIQTAFSRMGIFSSHQEMSHLSAQEGDSSSRDDIEANIRRAVQPEIERGVVGVHESADGLVISLQEAGFFDSGAAEVRPSALAVLNRIAAALPATPMRIEGHTDNVPIHNAQFASNWELSSARASTIARLLLLHPNVEAQQISVAGYAQYHPAAGNDTVEGRARNRRVDIILLKSPTL